MLFPSVLLPNPFEARVREQQLKKTNTDVSSPVLEDAARVVPLATLKFRTHTLLQQPGLLRLADAVIVMRFDMKPQWGQRIQRQLALPG